MVRMAIAKTGRARPEKIDDALIAQGGKEYLERFVEERIAYEISSLYLCQSARRSNRQLFQRKIDSAKIVKNFLELVRRNGNEVHLRKILEEAARFARGASGIRKVTVSSARPSPARRKRRSQSS